MGLLSSEVMADPHRFYDQLRESDEIAFDEDTKSYLFARFDDCLLAYKDERFTTRSYEWQLEPVHGRTILQMDGAEHQKKRRILSRSFRGDQLRALEPKISMQILSLIDDAVEKATGKLLEPLKTGVEFEFLDAVANRLPVWVIAEMLDIPNSDYPKFVRWYESIVRVLSNLSRDPQVMEEGERTKKEVRAYFAPLVAERRAAPADDLISQLCEAEVDGVELSDDEILSYCSLLLTAGAETTDRALGSLMRNLLTHPDQLEQVKQDPELAVAAVAESLRVSPPSQMNTRELSADVEIRGQVIPAGATVTVLLASGNRDERRFADPHSFDIHREDLDVRRVFTGSGEHLAFGAGRHYCLGAMLARSEMVLATQLILERFPNIRPADGFDPNEYGLKMRGPQSVLVTT